MLQPLGSCSPIEIVNSFSLSDGYSDFDTKSFNNSEFTDNYTPLFFEFFKAMLQVLLTSKKLLA